eukprot:2614237-Alexandrium_andersonii.AAC.1
MGLAPPLRTAQAGSTTRGYSARCPQLPTYFSPSRPEAVQGRLQLAEGQVCFVPVLPAAR